MGRRLVSRETPFHIVWSIMENVHRGIMTMPSIIRKILGANPSKELKPLFVILCIGILFSKVFVSNLGLIVYKTLNSSR